MIKPLAIVFALTLAGDILVETLNLSVPGPAIGLLLLAAGFALNGGVDEGTAKLFDTVSPHFPMFFIPAAVGLIAHIDLIASAWVYIVVAVTLGTAVTIISTGWLAQTLLNAVKRTDRICLTL